MGIVLNLSQILLHIHVQQASSDSVMKYSVSDRKTPQVHCTLNLSKNQIMTNIQCCHRWLLLLFCSFCTGLVLLKFVSYKRCSKRLLIISWCTVLFDFVDHKGLVLHWHWRTLNHSIHMLTQRPSDTVYSDAFIAAFHYHFPSIAGRHSLHTATPVGANKGK